MEVITAQKNLASLLSNKLMQEYSEMCGFLRAWMSLAIVRSNTLLLCGAKDKEACICHRPDLENKAVMELIAPWQG